MSQSKTLRTVNDRPGAFLRSLQGRATSNTLWRGHNACLQSGQHRRPTTNHHHDSSSNGSRGTSTNTSNTSSNSSAATPPPSARTQHQTTTTTRAAAAAATPPPPPPAKTATTPTATAATAAAAATLVLPAGLLLRELRVERLQVAQQSLLVDEGEQHHPQPRHGLPVRVAGDLPRRRIAQQRPSIKDATNISARFRKQVRREVNRCWL